MCFHDTGRQGFPGDTMVASNTARRARGGQGVFEEMSINGHQIPGDSVSALDTVLNADVERAYLMKEKQRASI